MTRHFYTDPLAAAWMAKHFGIEFRYWRWNDLSFQFTPVNARAVELDSSKLYIHPDSLHLLEPQVGDEYLLPRWKTGNLTGYRAGYYNGVRKARGCQLHGDRIGDEYYFSDTPDGHAQPFSIRDSVPEKRNVADVFKAIGFPKTRNGKPFHWPESEAV
jgi:hypothetical protein